MSNRAAVLVALSMLIPIALPLIPTAAAAGSSSFGSGAPTFTLYHAPSTMPEVGGSQLEPSIGINWNTNALMFQSHSSTYRVTFDSQGVATWLDKSAPESIINVDPILETDQRTGRTWAGGLDGACSILGFSDNDGDSWLPVGNSCVATLDHESLGSGPFAPPLPSDGTPLYEHALYYCAQAVAVTCAASYDGGLTFQPTVNVPGCDNNPMSGGHGTVHVSPNGHVWVPFSSPGIFNDVCLGHSADNGLTFEGITIPGSGVPVAGFDADLASTPSSWLYVGYPDQNGRAHMALSKDNGQTWTISPDLGAPLGVKVTTFHEAVAGDDNRAAIAFMGTTQSSVSAAFTDNPNGCPACIWRLYVAYTYDGGQTWTTVQASDDIIQRGPVSSAGTLGDQTARNLADFMDAQIDADGRVVVGLGDGCINACNNPGGLVSQSRTAWPTIVRQTTGRGLFAAKDAAGVTITTSPTGLAGSSSSLAATLSGVSPFSVTVTWGDNSAPETFAGVVGPAFGATHTYASAGSYDVTVSATDASSSTATATTNADITQDGTSGGNGVIHITSPAENDAVGDLVHVTGDVTTSGTNHAPVAAFTSTVTGTSVAFDATGSSDQDGDTLVYTWAFGDATTGSGVTTSKTYSSAGTYNVCLTVSDGALSANVCHDVTISTQSSVRHIADDVPGDATGPAGTNVPALDILKVEATTNANGEPQFILTVADMSTNPQPSEGANGVFWMLEWTGPDDETGYIQLVANTFVDAAGLGALECKYGTIDATAGRTLNQEGAAICTVTAGPNGKAYLTYPAAGLSAHQFSATSTFAGLIAEAGVVRGAPNNPVVTAQSSINYDSTDAQDFQISAANARWPSFGILQTAAPRTAPTAPPANPQITDNVDDTPFESVPQANVQAAWFDSDADYLYVGLKLEDIPADPNTTAYTMYEVSFLPGYTYNDATWNGVVAAGETLVSIRAFAAFQPVAANLSSLFEPGVDQATAMDFKLQATATDGAQNHFGNIATVGGSVDATTDIIWWQIPRTLLQNPPGGAALTQTAASSGVSFAGAGTLGGVDATGPGEDYVFPMIQVDPPQVTLAADRTSGTAPLSVIITPTIVAEANLATWSIDMDDGSTDGGAGAPPASFSHIYTAAGTYTATLTVTDVQGNAGTGSLDITVGDGGSGGATSVVVSAPGVPSVTATCANACATWTADLDVSAHDAGPVMITATLYSGNTVQSVSTVNVTIERTSSAALVIDTPGAGTSVPAGQVNVTGRLAPSSDLAPRAILSADRVQGPTPLTVTFTIDGTDDHGITSWSLDTGDGAVPTGAGVPASASHTYTTGDYVATLTVRDAAGHSDSRSLAIRVSAANIAPTAPHTPSPANGATGVVALPTLSWQSEDGNGDALRYDVYVDGAPAVLDTPSTSHLVGAAFAAGSTHSWNVVAKDGTTSTTGPTWTFTVAQGQLTEAQKPHVVVGGVDTGINPYHAQFRRPEMTVNPATYVTGMPANVKQINLCFFDNATKTVDQSRCPASAAAAPDQDATEWAKIQITPTSQTGAGQGNLYWFAGTNVFVISFNHAGTAGFVGLDGAKGAGDSHGTATSSNVVGATTGSCPECYYVMLESSLNTELGPAYTWLSNQPYIDVVTSSLACGPAGHNPAGLNPICGQPTHTAVKNAVSKGKLFFESSGNGLVVPGLGGTQVPTSTGAFANFNPWTIAVGCNEPTGNWCLYSDTPNAIEGTGIVRKSANTDTYSSVSDWAGTSFSAPSSAGVAARTIYALRAEYNDLVEGPSTTADRSFVRLNGQTPPASGPLSNGYLTRNELEEVLFKTARRDFNPLDADSFAGINQGWIHVSGNPASFAKEGYGEVYHGQWGVNHTLAQSTWSTSGDMLSVIRGVKPLPNRWVEETYWEQIIEPAQESVFRDTEIPDADGLADGYPRDDAMDQSNLGGYRPSAVTPPIPIPASTSAIPTGVQPTSEVNRLYVHAADVGPDPANPGSELFEYYLNSIAQPEDPSCSGAGCADSNAGATGGGGFSATYTVAHPALTGTLLLDQTKDVVVHIRATGFVGGPPTTTSMTAAIESNGALVGSATVDGVPDLDGTTYEFRFKPLTGALGGETTLSLSTTDVVYSIFISGYGDSYVDLPIASNLGPEAPVTPVTYFVDNFASFSSNGMEMTITRDAGKLAGDADLNGVVFRAPQAEGVNMPVVSDDVLATSPTLLASEGQALVYVCSPGVTDTGLAQATVTVTLSVGGTIIGGGSLTKVLAGIHGGDTEPFVVPLAIHPALVALDEPLRGTISIAGPGGVTAHNIALCGGGASHPWTIQLGTKPLSVPSATLDATPSTLTGQVTLSGAYNAPARPDLENVVWYAQDFGEWRLGVNEFTLETGAPGTSTGGPLLPPEPFGMQLTFRSARPLAEDATALSRNGVGMAQFWVAGIGPLPQATVDMSVLLEDGSGAQRLLGEGSVTRNVAAFGEIVPVAPYTVSFTPLVTDPKADERLVLVVTMHNAGPAWTPNMNSLAGGEDMPIFVSLPKALDTTPTQQEVDIDIGALHTVATVANGQWSKQIDSRAVANGAQTLTITPRATYAGTVIGGLPVSRNVDVQNAVDTPPTATLGLTPLTGTAPLLVDATVGGADAETLAPLLTWSISWGDGTSDATGLGVPATASHTYATPGTYTATLTVRDGAGQIATSSKTTTVLEPRPVENLLVSLDGGAAVAALDDSGDGSFSSWHLVLDIQTSGIHNVTAQHTRDGVVVDTASVEFSVYRTTEVAITTAEGATLDNGQTITGTTAGDAPITSVVASLSPDFTSPVAATSTDSFATWAVSIDALGLVEDQPTSVYVRASTASDYADDVVGVTLNAAPNAVLSVLSTLPAYTQSGVRFQGSGQPAASGAAITGFAWDLGDGTLSTEVAPTHAYAHSGTYLVTLTVTDANAKTGTATRSVLILDQAPIVTITVTPASPTDLETATISVDAVDNDGTIVGTPQVTVKDPAGNVIATGAAPLSYQFPDDGTYTVLASAFDNENVEGTGETSVTVLNVRPSALLTASTSLVGVDQPVRLDASGSSDPDGTVASYVFDFGDGDTAASTSAIIDHAYASAGTYLATVDVTDDDGYTVTSDAVTIIVNAAPVLDPVGLKVISEGATLAFTVTATDAENDALSFGATPLPTGATFNPTTGAFSWTPTQEQQGNYLVNYTVTDGLNTDYELAYISVGNVDRPPVLGAVGDKVGLEATLLTFVLSATDLDATDTLTYTMTSLPSEASLDSVTGVFTWTPTYFQSGTYSVTFTVSDGEITDSETIQIEIANNDRAPVLDAIPGGVVKQLSTITLPLHATDADGETISFRLTSPPDGMVIVPVDAQNAQIRWTPSIEYLGDVPVTVVASSGSLSDVGTTTITVRFTAGLGLVSTAPPTTEVAPNTVTAFTATVTNTGPNTDTFTLTGTAGSGWGASGLPPTIQLGAGQSATVTLGVESPPTGTVTFARISATSQGDPTVQSVVSARFDLGITLAVEVEHTDVPGLDTGAGVLRARYLDGSPAPDVTVGITQTWRMSANVGTTQSGVTNAAGGFAFDFGADARGLLPGAHDLRATGRNGAGAVKTVTSVYTISVTPPEPPATPTATELGATAWGSTCGGTIPAVTTSDVCRNLQGDFGILSARLCSPPPESNLAAHTAYTTFQGTPARIACGLSAYTFAQQGLAAAGLTEGTEFAWANTCDGTSASVSDSEACKNLEGNLGVASVRLCQAPPPSNAAATAAYQTFQASPGSAACGTVPIDQARTQIAALDLLLP